MVLLGSVVCRGVWGASGSSLSMYFSDSFSTPLPPQVCKRTPSERPGSYWALPLLFFPPDWSLTSMGLPRENQKQRDTIAAPLAVNCLHKVIDYVSTFIVYKTPQT